MKTRKPAGLAVAAVLSAVLLGGCEGLQPTAPADSQPTSTDGANAPSSSSISLAAVPDSMVLAPGAKKTLPYGDGVTYHSSAPDVVTVGSNGELSVSSQAKAGSTATVTVEYQGERKDVTITVKPSLAATVTMVNGIPTVTNPDDLVVVVNKERALPADYVPPRLVEPNVPFTFSGKAEKRLLREEAARALEELFAKAKQDGIQLYGVSGYRSYQTQKGLFEGYVKTQGAEHANRYSAQPGKSEHQTGLAIDVAGTDPSTLLEEPFADTREGKWLAEHCAEFGFIIRYLKGKEEITGYAYEPWHIRYVGKEVAKEIMSSGVTLEEYFQDSGQVQAR
ncbi:MULTISPECIES: D-alanyl-D-alanine carboxypeptidase family protein [Brevibacillus]|jgi:zinc D-Ala-D-Ala carboxypeptidase|uniref:M15 family metallopeptidase n=1 Tax=Brevibacillus TaxID=55080 RepID=UPI002013156F|nr:MULTISPECIES: M15 family metallopeptidase [Brevibacillus]MDT3414708.1 D-alanyl-D-alanine carboxypeptidase [Brevibacillus aydinogluensis]